MAKLRPTIPPKIETELLFINDRTCCICREDSKGIQIHHIDSNPSNNSIKNLAVVCTHHHDQIHKTGGVTKRISPRLLKKYKHEWELTVFKKRTKDFTPLKSESKIEEMLFEFEIRKIAFEILSIEDNDKKEIIKRLEFYHSLYLLEGYDDKILEAINQIIVLSALSDENKSSLIAERIHEFFFHLPGPGYVKITNDDIKNIKTGIEILGTLGGFSAEFNRSDKVNNSIIISLDWLFEIAIYYDKVNIANDLIKIVNKIIIACNVKDKGVKFESGILRFKKLIKDWQKFTKKEQPSWKLKI
ncbi:HNH endonuclease signature motif containing protein [Bacteroidota bacterium]